VTFILIFHRGKTNNKEKKMKATMIITAALLVGSMAMAADAEHKETADTSKNPVTGTVTETHTQEGHDAGGNKMKSKTKKKTHKDGKVEETTETKKTTETEPKH